MKTVNSSRAVSQWLLPILVGCLACCASVAAVVCLGAVVFVPIQRKEAGPIPTLETIPTPVISLDSTATLVPTLTSVVAPVCEDADCLSACLRQIPDFEVEPLTKEDARALKEKSGGYDLVRYRLDEEDKTIKRIAIPTVPDYLILYQGDEELHHRIWDYFTGIFPNDEEFHVSYLIITMDASEDSYSAAIWNSQGKWRLYVNLLDFDSSNYAIETMTHEYGHMLTLNDDQVKGLSDEYGLEMERSDYDSMQSKCEGYFFTGTECTLENSYLDQFGNRFWTGDPLEAWIDAFLLYDKGQDLYEKAQEEFYRQYRDHFVTEYAATSPTEDIAETWTEFVMRPQPTGVTVADQKVLFFYEYPELVELRSEIIQGVCQYAFEQK